MFVSISGYFEYKVVTNIQVNHVFSLPFPIVSICDKKGIIDQEEMNDNGGISFENLKCVEFSNTQIQTNHDFEHQNDPLYGKCIQFNSGISNNGSFIQFKHIHYIIMAYLTLFD